ncbi:hypothetical protein V1389_02040 [Flavobacterium rakeshii]|uniref:hypothetical protein n=1 Tax=Flavobacterium rakeshii TaxID=1038845 RepID=UPI002E7B8E55|nr:hypothetical protein [Flavobacterium rakeshii]MEE1897097.1 hypothetical protein [Flavobacterium rakeshii]
MTLAFSTKLNGKETLFVEKIWAGLLSRQIFSLNDMPDKLYNNIPDKECYGDKFKGINEKLHTIRADVKDRWTVGKSIHFVINNRTKNRYQFAPVATVKSIETIKIKYNDGGGVNVFINNEFFYYQTSWGLEWDAFSKRQMLTLAKNDGFDSIADFFAYFNKDFTGKIIHWTDLKYSIGFIKSSPAL